MADEFGRLKIRQLLKEPSFSGKTNNIYLWSDFHFHDASIISISNRNFWTGSLVNNNYKIPDTKNLDETILNKLNNLEEDSVLINQGDLGRITSVEDELFIKNMNDTLHSKNIDSILILGNHDWLSENLIYNAYSGKEKEFYTALGFDRVYLNPVVLEDKNNLNILSHKPIRSDCLRNLSKSFFEGLKIINYYGHWHSYKVTQSEETVDTNVDQKYISACIDYKPEPINLGCANLYNIYETGLNNDSFFLPDPWLNPVGD